MQSEAASATPAHEPTLAFPASPPPEIAALAAALALLQHLIVDKKKHYASLDEESKDQDVHDRAVRLVPMVEHRIFRAPLSMMHECMDRLAVAQYAEVFDDAELDVVCNILARASFNAMPWLYAAAKKSESRSVDQQPERPSTADGFQPAGDSSRLGALKAADEPPENVGDALEPAYEEAHRLGLRGSVERASPVDALKADLSRVAPLLSGAPSEESVDLLARGPQHLVPESGRAGCGNASLNIFVQPAPPAATAAVGAPSPTRTGGLRFRNQQGRAERLKCSGCDLEVEAGGTAVLGAAHSLRPSSKRWYTCGTWQAVSR